MIKGKKGGSLSKRYQESYDTKEKGNSSKSGIMNYKKVDGEVSFFSPQEGRNRINIIPYTIKTKNHPLVKKGEMEIGDQDYVMDVFVHRGIGPSEASCICLKQTFGKPCPVCEQSALLRKQGKEKEAGDLKPTRRVIYNVEDLKDSGKIKVFETSHYLFEKELIDEARDDDEGGFVDFADPENGKEIKFRCNKVSKNGFQFSEFKSFTFNDRDEPVSDELLESAISFDEIMNIPTYEEVEKILYGQDDDEEDEKPSKKSKNSDDDEEDDDSDEEETPKKNTSKKQVEEDSDDEDDDEPVKKPSKKRHEEDDSDDDEEEDEKPSKPVKKHSDEDEEDSDEDDETPKKKKSCDKNCGECPFGHKFGKDVDKFDDCDDCDVWDKCINSNG